MLFLLPLVAILGVAIADPSKSPRANYVIHEKRAIEPVDWVKSDRLPADKILPMRFGLTQQNLDKLEEMLMAVSHPDSPTYGQHYSPAKVVETFAPSHKTISSVKEWLVGAGISADRLRLTQGKGWIEVNATAAEVEDLLDTEYHVYSHPSGATQIGKALFVLSLILILADPSTYIS